MDKLTWRKSSFSGGEGNCVEVAMHDSGISVRDTKDNGSGPELTFTPAEWQAFLNAVRAGEFDITGDIAAA